MFVSGIGDGSILLLCLLDFIAVLTVWLSICLLGVSVMALSYDCVLLDFFIALLRVWLSICLLVVSVLALFYYCVY